MKEKIIKSKLRVQKHGEVFTPKKTINKMLNIPEIKETCENLTATFLEPSAGEGAFLVEILKRKLKMVSEKHNNDLTSYESYSLFALTTLYGIELLEDNAQTCVMNMFQLYYDNYKEQVRHYNGTIKKKVLDSAKEIISSNIRQGNFLTRKAVDGKPLVFSEWSPVNLRKTTKNIKIQRTEYTLDEIYESVKKESGMTISRVEQRNLQLDIFDILEIDDIEDEIQKEMRYIPVNIINVYKEEMEEANG
ncbi:N-6 DNA methylase [Bacillus safensis]|uniref:N-6 DNA methylase n=1 Tax=Bacillus safensis TaxID=561879 RepID=UPI002E1BB034|nr:N-6 DNA methylase [Bacillus safensis]